MSTHVRGASLVRPHLIAPVGLLAVATTTGVFWLADAAGEHDGPSTLDPRVAGDMLDLRSPGLTLLARTLTLIGSEVTVGILAAVILLALLVRRSWTRATVFATGMAGSAFLTLAIKLLVARPRPGAVDRLGPVDSSYSFPSGHTLYSAVFLGLVCWLLWPALTRTLRPVVAASATVLAVGVGCSRLYLGYHWFTDVLASALVAVSWLSVVFLLSRLLAGPTTPGEQPHFPGTPGRRAHPAGTLGSIDRMREQVQP